MTHNAISQKTAFPRVNLLSIALLCAAVLGVSFVFSQRAAAISPVPVIVATVKDKCDKGGFLGLEPWYHFIPDSEIGVPAKVVNGNVVVPADNCGVRCFNIFVQQDPNECGETSSNIPGVVLAVIDDLLRIAGLVAVAFIFIGAFQYVGSRGNSEKTAQAQSTVLGALTGLAVVLVAVAFVSFLGSQLKGP